MTVVLNKKRENEINTNDQEKKQVPNCCLTSVSFFISLPLLELKLSTHFLYNTSIVTMTGSLDLNPLLAN